MKNRWLGTLINTLNMTSRVLMLIAQEEVTTPRGLQVTQTKEQGHILRVFFMKKIIRKSLVTPLKLGFVTFVVLCFHTSKSTYGAQNNTVKSSVADPDPFHFRPPDPTPA